MLTSEYWLYNVYKTDLVTLIYKLYFECWLTALYSSTLSIEKIILECVLNEVNESKGGLMKVLLMLLDPLTTIQNELFLRTEVKGTE